MIGLFLLVFLLLAMICYKNEVAAYWVFSLTILFGLLVFWHHATLVIDINL